jgi:hypothetical protein
MNSGGYGVGTCVSISLGCPEATLQGKTGRIRAVRKKDHFSEYLVELDRGLTGNPLLAGERVWIRVDYIEPPRLT